GEVDAGDADALRERAVVVGTGVAGLHVDVVVGARGEHALVGRVGRMGRVDGDRGLVLLVLRERAHGTADADAGVLRGGRAGEPRESGQHRGYASPEGGGGP